MKSILLADNCKAIARIIHYFIQLDIRKNAFVAKALWWIMYI